MFDRFNLTLLALIGAAVITLVFLYLNTKVEQPLDYSKVLEVYTPHNIYYIDIENLMIFDEVGYGTVKFADQTSLINYLSKITADESQLPHYAD